MKPIARVLECILSSTMCMYFPLWGADEPPFAMLCGDDVRTYMVRGDCISFGAWSQF